MKIKKLEIMNIASIEEACIDFGSTPLKDADIFLITGITGSGKTTILDAICLALYNTVPRMANLAHTTIEANSDKLRLNDPRNVMRLNTGEAFARLQFEGNDGHTYEAEWAVQRGALKKVSTQMGNAVWSLHRIEPGTKTLLVSGNNNNNYREVQAQIQTIIGLDFAQFCRTTLLAQGQFTMFLKSDENEKSAILEKITGTGIYSKIGAVIFRIKADKEKAYNQQLQAYQAIQVLTPEERQEVEQQLRLTNDQITAKTLEQNDWLARINWLQIKHDDNIRLQSALTRLTTAQQALLEDSYLRRKATIQQWQDTRDIRSTIQQQDTTQELLQQTQDQLMQLHAQWAHCMAGRKHLEEHIHTLLTDCQTRQEALAGQEAYLPVYQNITDIHTQLIGLANTQREQQQLHSAIQTDQQALLRIRQQEQTDLQALQQADQRLQQQRKAIELLTLQLNQIPHTLYRQQREALNTLIQCASKIAHYDQQIQTQQDAIQAIQTDTLETAIQKLQQDLNEATSRRDFCQLSVREAAKMLRTHLHSHLGQADCVCPVCKQAVATLPADAELSETVRQLNHTCEQLTTQLQQTKQQLDQCLQQRHGLQAALQHNQQERDSQLRCKADTLATLNEADQLRWANATIDTMQREAEQLLELITNYDQLQRVCNNQQQTCNDLQQHVTQAQSALHQTQQTATACHTRITQNEHTYQHNQATIEASIRYLTDALATVTPLLPHWQQDPKAVATQLQQQSEAYLQAAAQLDKQRTLLQQEQLQLQQIDAIRTEIEALRGTSLQPDTTCSIDQLHEAWRQLLVDLRIATQREHECQQALLQHQQAWLAFAQDHPDYTLQQVRELNRITPADCDNILRQLQATENEEREAKILYEESQNQLQEHYQNPQMHPASAQEDDDAATMQARSNTLEQEKNACIQRQYELTQTIRQDDENQLKKSQTQHLEQLHIELERWKQLCNIFGDSEGTKMRKIAQSFILSTLLDAANYHLNRMSDRYRLLVIQNTLDMKLEDKYQGFATRNVHSISGGESFMVSLSLALALADFGQGIGVETLFIDEGFGTLSGEHLQRAIHVLQSLHSDMHRQVGIISHREEIQEHIPVQICVELPANSSTSRIHVIDKRM